MFEYYFSEYTFEGEETAVCCPFPHYTVNNMEYFETNPSAHINLSKGLFHCKVCDRGLSETAFISEILGCSYEDAVKVSKLFRSGEDFPHWFESNPITEDIKNLCKKFLISDEVIEELSLGTEQGDEIAFPVTMYGKLIDVRSYRPHDKLNKIKSRSGAKSGCIIPYDVWRTSPTNKWTIICAGEKDMAVTRSMGFNAITLTGGEKALPIAKKQFQDRKIAICYDNDDAGLAGARGLAAFLQPIAAEVKVVTGFHEVCVEKGEDLTDFFVKYKQDRKALQEYIKGAPVFTAEEAKEEQQRQKPLITLIEASTPKYINRVVQSNIQVVATFDKAMPVPTMLFAKKINSSGDARGNAMMVGEERNWELTEKTCQDILKLIDNNFDEDRIRANTREILKISKYEKEVRIDRPTKETVYQCNVIDLFEATSKDVTTIEFNAYVLRKRLESGKKYLVTYKLVPHPYKGQQLTMIILDAEDASDSITNFQVNDETKMHLKKIQDLKGTVEERVTHLTEMTKYFIGYNGYNKLIQAVDLSYHTVLEFNFGSFQNVRGYLDTIIVAESRVGKSSTAEALQKLYGLGAFASLAGNSATIPGLIGGSNKVGGQYQTKAGLIPMNHRGLIIFEELAKCNGSLVRELTDIRSSNQVRISRVSGTLSLPALVRMITLTNVKSRGGRSQPINAYPNGIEVLLELIETAEDMARYDIMLVMGDTGQTQADPFWQAEVPFDEEIYRTRIRWVWSRTPEQIVIDAEVGRYIIERCNELNKIYDSHIKIFGTEAWKKVARLAIATAGYLVSTDDAYERIIVNKEHVDFAVKWLVAIYDNPTFKLKEYCDMEKMYNTIDDIGVELLQDLYNQCAALLLQLERTPKTNKQNLQAATGLDNELYNKLMQRMSQGLFIQYEGYDIVPTTRFRKGIALINRQGRIHRVGERDA